MTQYTSVNLLVYQLLTEQSCFGYLVWGSVHIIFGPYLRLPKFGFAQLESLLWLFVIDFQISTLCVGSTSSIDCWMCSGGTYSSSAGTSNCYIFKGIYSRGPVCLLSWGCIMYMHSAQPLRSWTWFWLMELIAKDTWLRYSTESIKKSSQSNSSLLEPLKKCRGSYCNSEMPKDIDWNVRWRELTELLFTRREKHTCTTMLSRCYNLHILSWRDLL